MKKLWIFPLLTACAQIGGPLAPGYPTGVNDTCKAERHARLIGKPATALETTLLLQPVRIIHPNSAVTMDFIDSRINFHLDTASNIQKIRCG